MKQYLDVLRNVLNHGHDRLDRTGVGTRALFMQTMRFQMADGFPAVTTKKLAFKQVRGELLAFIAGASSLNEFHKYGVRIWDDNASASYWLPKAQFEGDLGRIYGVQWRSWQAPDGQVIDQLADVIEQLKTNPYSRRHVVSAWNPGELDQMALPPCHMFFQFFVADGKLSLSMYQRSADMFLGVPFNIASYSLLLHMIAHVTNLEPDEFIHVLGDAHIYRNHFQQVETQLKRKPLSLPKLEIKRMVKSIDGFEPEDLVLVGYQHRGIIKAPMAV